MLWQGQAFGFKSGWLDENGKAGMRKLDYRPGLVTLDSDAGQSISTP